MRRKDVYVPRFLRATHLRHRRFAAMHSVAIYLRRVYTCRNGLYVRARDITVYIVGRSVYRVHLPPPPGRESVGGECLLPLSSSSERSRSSNDDDGK